MVRTESKFRRKVQQQHLFTSTFLARLVLRSSLRWLPGRREDQVGITAEQTKPLLLQVVFSKINAK